MLNMKSNRNGILFHNVYESIFKVELLLLVQDCTGKMGQTIFHVFISAADL